LSAVYCSVYCSMRNTCICIYTRVHMFADINIYIYNIYIYIYIYTFTYIHVHICICIFVYIDANIVAMCFSACRSVVYVCSRACTGRAAEQCVLQGVVQDVL